MVDGNIHNMIYTMEEMAKENTELRKILSSYENDVDCNKRGAYCEFCRHGIAEHNYQQNIRYYVCAKNIPCTGFERKDKKENG